MADSQDTPRLSGDQLLRSLGFTLPMPRRMQVRGLVGDLPLMLGSAVVVLPADTFEGPGIYLVFPGAPRFLRVTDLPGGLRAVSDDAPDGYRAVLSRTQFEEEVLARYVQDVRPLVSRPRRGEGA
ncbi:hypothetical protein ACI6QG_05425 [Roseococcus sp. DSY-14]|uniref:hypothetical protein n=1 Tax=Roseococcus sp. DSY-14 TaxID=3369650 RepID=UPI00387B3736